jgi:DNA-binding FadR family transcriptional regulator
MLIRGGRIAALGFEHEHLLQAVRQRDATAAERAARAHVMANAEAIAACLPHGASALATPITSVAAT